MQRLSEGTFRLDVYAARTASEEDENRSRSHVMLRNQQKRFLATSDFRHLTFIFRVDSRTANYIYVNVK